MTAEKSEENEEEGQTMEEADLVPIPPIQGATRLPTRAQQPLAISPIVTRQGESATRRYLEFFAVTIRNPHTRRAYWRACSRLLDFAEERGVADLRQIQPMLIAAYIERRCQEQSPPTVKQELAAIRQLFDYLVTGHIVEVNPAAAVKGPRYSIAVGKTPVLTRDEARRLLESIPITLKVKGEGRAEVEHPDVLGLRDRALIGLMVFSFARVGAVTKVKVGDYYQSGKRWKVRLHEKGGKFHELPVHHKAEVTLPRFGGLVVKQEPTRQPFRGRRVSRTRRG